MTFNQEFGQASAEMSQLAGKALNESALSNPTSHLMYMMQNDPDLWQASQLRMKRFRANEAIDF